jgi:hypothetical protein
MAMVYTTLFLIGLLGLFAQLMLGSGHVHGTGHNAGGQAAGHGHAGHGHGSHHHGIQGIKGGLRARGSDFLWTLLSPLTIFSICLGMGLTGLLLKHHNPHAPISALAAALGGLALYAVIVRPIWNLVFRFATQPSRALEGSTAQSVEAISRFDASGKGLVRLTIDGQVVRILAQLETDEKTQAPEIQPGEKLTITSVDGRTNTCRVARL